MNTKDWIIPELRELPTLKKAIEHIPDEINTLDDEMRMIKATDYNKDKVDSSENTQEDKMISIIAKKVFLQNQLTFTNNQIKNIEERLSLLPEEERNILELMVIRRQSNEQLKEFFHVEQAQLYNLRNKAILHYATLKFGYLGEMR